MKIAPTHPDDIYFVQKIYMEARAYQYKKTGYGWHGFSRDLIESEIAEKRHFKIVDEEGEIAGIFSVVYTEPVIWNDTEGKEAIYLHRMATGDRHRGREAAKRIVEWATGEARRQKKKFVRIDTWADNTALTAYYRRLGFVPAGKKQLPPESDLPEHYNNIEVSLFEIKIPPDEF